MRALGALKKGGTASLMSLKGVLQEVRMPAEIVVIIITFTFRETRSKIEKDKEHNSASA